MKKGGGPSLRQELGDIGYLESHPKYVYSSKMQVVIGSVIKFKDPTSKWQNPVLSPLMDRRH